MQVNNIGLTLGLIISALPAAKLQWEFPNGNFWRKFPQWEISTWKFQGRRMFTVKATRMFTVELEAIRLSNLLITDIDPHLRNMQHAHDTGSGAPVQATLLIDMPWLHHSSSQAGIHVDLPKLSQRLEQQLGCQFMHKGVYTAYRPDLADTDSAQMTPHPLIQHLQANVHSFPMKVRPSHTDTSSMSGVLPSSVDVALCLGVAEAVIARRPLLVLVAADGDFAFIIQWMKLQIHKASMNFRFILAVPSKKFLSVDLVALTDGPSDVIEFASWEEVSTPNI